VLHNENLVSKRKREKDGRRKKERGERKQRREEGGRMKTLFLFPLLFFLFIKS
jgi:hypothetical protein